MHDDEFVDFTTATSWEKITREIEIKLDSWKTECIESPNKDLQLLYEFMYRNTMFVLKLSTISHGHLIESKLEDEFELFSAADIDTYRYDFCGGDELHRWLGSPIVLYLDKLDEKEAWNVCDVKLVASSVIKSLGSLKWFIPIAFPISHSSQPESTKCIYYHPVEFGDLFIEELFATHKVPRNMGHLGALYDLIPNAKVASEAFVSAILTFSLDNWIEWNHGDTLEWKSYLAGNDPNKSDLRDLVIPTGPFKIPIKVFMVDCYWPKFKSTENVENAVYSDFNVDTSPLMFFRLKIRKFKPLSKRYRLASTLRIIQGLINDMESSIPFIEKHCSISNLEMALPSVLPGIMSSDHNIDVDSLIAFLFKKTDRLESKVLRECFFTEKLFTCVLFIFSINHESRSKILLNLSKFWRKLVEELEMKFFKGHYIPCCSKDPNLTCCLLDQKLILLNYCIAKEKKETTLYGKKRRNLAHLFEMNLKKSAESDDEDFYEVLEETPKSGGEGIEKSLNFKSLSSGLPLYVPFTQDVGYYTEDQFDEECIESSAHKERAERHLLSDMEAFKAANPNCCLEDFVRWHSPKDWISDNDLEGHLSVRMSDSDCNIWHKLWNAAKSIPAEKQQPLFNHIAEAQNILEYFKSLSLFDFLHQFLPKSKELSAYILNIKKHVDFDDFIGAVEKAEFEKGISDALLDKIDIHNDKFFLNAVISNPEGVFHVPNHLKSTISDFFKGEGSVPCSKEFIIRCGDCKIYSKIKQSEFKVIRTIVNK